MIKRTTERYAWTPEDHTAAANLKQIYLQHKHENGLTQLKLANVTGLNRSTVAQHINQLAPIRQEAAKLYAAYFKVHVGDIHPRYKGVRLVGKIPPGYKQAPPEWTLLQKGGKLYARKGKEEFYITDL